MTQLGSHHQPVQGGDQGYLERTEYLFFGQKPKKTPIIVFKWAKTKAVLKNREGAKGTGQKYLQEGGSSIL